MAQEQAAPPLGSAVTKDEGIAVLEAYQERLEAALRQDGKAYDALFDGAPPGVALHEIDPDKIVRRVNACELEILGYREDEVVGRSCTQFVVMRDVSERSASKKLSGGGLRPFVRAFTRKDGTSVTMAVVERYLRDPKGEIQGIRTALTPVRL